MGGSFDNEVISMEATFQRTRNFRALLIKLNNKWVSRRQRQSSLVYYGLCANANIMMAAM